MGDDPADGWFGESVASGYDTGGGLEFSDDEIERTVDLLHRLADGGPVLEFAIGTGRIALPLARRGVDVSGIELSRAMAQRLAAKPGGEYVKVAIGDMTSTRIEGEFSVVCLVFNTINNLVTQDEQVACFRNAAAHLRPGGRFVVEVGVPELRRLPPGQDTVPFYLDTVDGGGAGGFDRYDVVTQKFTSSHFRVDGDRGRFLSIPFRYVWPSELDLMARIAGLQLESRWADWTGSPFDADGVKHVSVRARPSR